MHSLSFTLQPDECGLHLLLGHQRIGAGQGGAADPILFYPDGTSATARIVLGNSRNHFVVVELRGLTGIARSSDLLTAEELPP